MVAKITHYPLGNADTTLIKLPRTNQVILWDFANMRDQNDSNDKRCDLPAELNKEVEGDYNVVCFTHADIDHIKGFSEYFYLEHAAKYQTEGRKRIHHLWVPAAILLETTLEDEAKILKAEAIYRLRNKSGIVIFSRPKKLKDWCDNQEDISYEDVKHFFRDAGAVMPDFSLKTDGVEFFVHSPFMSESQSIDRNGECVIVQAQFDDNCLTKLILGSDGTAELWKDIVNVTKHFNNKDKLNWDLFHISHHSSYLSLNTSGNKGDKITVPLDEIKWLFEEQGNLRSRLISPSHPIPNKGSESDNDQPPHRQAANYYKSVASKLLGEYIVTMESPSIAEPKPLVIEIDDLNCAKIVKKIAVGTSFVTTTPPIRAGNEY